MSLRVHLSNIPYYLHLWIVASDLQDMHMDHDRIICTVGSHHMFVNRRIKQIAATPNTRASRRNYLVNCLSM